MKCPSCGELDSKVIDSRLGRNGTVIRRRRECLACGRRFTTYERIEFQLPMVVKKDGRREAFQISKMVSGLRKAFEKRPFSVSEIEELADDVAREISELGEKEIQSTQIGERIMERLRSVDQVAYVRFASVYRSFTDVTQFVRELEELLTSRPGT